MAAPAEWTALVDPTAETLDASLPVDLYPPARRQLAAPHGSGEEPRPRIDSHGQYVFGVLLVAVVRRHEDRIFYQEVDFVLTRDRFLTVAKTPPGEEPYDARDVQSSCRPNESVALYAFRLIDDVAEGYLDLIDDINDEIDELEDAVLTWPADRVRDRISSLRHDLLHIRRTLTPTRDAVHKIVDDRVELDDFELFPRPVELHFADAYDKLLRATEGLETSRDLVAGVRDYFQARIASEQNEVMKRLTVVASLLLVPTFIVGVYGQNFRHIPELAWGFGYAWSWFLILVTTAAQLAYFRRKRWI